MGLIKRVCLGLACRMKEGGREPFRLPFAQLPAFAKLALVPTSLLMPSSFGYKNLVGSQAWCSLGTIIPALRAWKQEGGSRPFPVIGLSGLYETISKAVTT